MAEAFLKSFNSQLDVHSAGTRPAAEVHPKAIQVMTEAGLDLATHSPKLVDQFLGQSFDYVITVCDHAKETCPVFMGQVQHRLHMGFDDPADAKGSDGEILVEFRRVRDVIESRFRDFYVTHILSK